MTQEGTQRLRFNVSPFIEYVDAEIILLVHIYKGGSWKIVFFDTKNGLLIKSHSI